MEQNELVPQNEPVIINREITGFLKETCKWGKFLAIIGYIGIGILLLAGLFLITGSDELALEEYNNVPTNILGIVYLVIAFLYYFPVNYLYRFSAETRKGIDENNEERITLGFKNLKSIFHFMGILTIVMLGIYGLALLVMIAAGIGNLL